MVKDLSKVILPGQTIGIIGGGQLGKMMAISAKEMGFLVGILDPDPNCPASQVADWQIKAKYDNQESINLLAKRSDVISYEFENIDSEVLKHKELIGKVPQGIKLLEISQNRQFEKEFLHQESLPIAKYKIIDKPNLLDEATKFIGYPCVLKTTQGGYDGKGQVVLRDDSDKARAIELLKQGKCVLEEWIEFEKEISVIISRNSAGEISIFPIAENTHINNVLFTSLVPALVPDFCEKEAESIAIKIANGLEVSGTLTVELFVTTTGNLIVNEIAPRPHNSGHYSINACNFSQFDTHILGICNWSMPKIKLFEKTIMINLLGSEQTRAIEKLTTLPNWHFHFYGKKEEKEGRKMGHVTVVSDNIDQTFNDIKNSGIWINEEMTK